MFYEDYQSETERINKIINDNAPMEEIDIIEKEINDFLTSEKRRDMLTGEQYYIGKQKILDRKRMIIGRDGRLEEVSNLPDNRLVDNQYAKMLDQKVNYILGRPIDVECDNLRLRKYARTVFGKHFMRLLRAVCEDCLNGGIGWIYAFIGENGLQFKRFKPYEVLPLWEDNEHQKLNGIIRVFDTLEYRAKKEVKVTNAEFFKQNGVYSFVLENGRLRKTGYKPYISDENGIGYQWKRIPVFAFRQNGREVPLIKRVKGLQDALNEMRSDFMNNMQEDKRNTILVIKNYDGTDLGEFRRNLAQFGAVKVRSVDGADGGIDTLEVEVNCDNYVAVCDMLKKAIVENARGYDARDERMNSNPNQMNIKSMYSDIDLDANAMESEFQCSLEDIAKLMKEYAAAVGIGSFDDEIRFIFNKDQMINESEVIEDCKKSIGILSNRTVIDMHPWNEDTEREIKRLKEENV